MPSYVCPLRVAACGGKRNSFCRCGPRRPSGCARYRSAASAPGTGSTAQGYREIIVGRLPPQAASVQPRQLARTGARILGPSVASEDQASLASIRMPAIAASGGLAQGKAQGQGYRAGRQALQRRPSSAPPLFVGSRSRKGIATAQHVLADRKRCTLSPYIIARPARGPFLRVASRFATLTFGPYREGTQRHAPVGLALVVDDQRPNAVAVASKRRRRDSVGCASCRLRRQRSGRRCRPCPYPGSAFKTVATLIGLVCRFPNTDFGLPGTGQAQV